MKGGEGLARDLEAMGPTFVKAGQLLSTRPDLLPVEYLLALSRLHDKVEPFDSEEAEQILVEELGVRISKAFSRFDSEPIASASLGQVHYAEMRDGRPVAVKIQRPGVRQQVASDLEAMEEIAEMMAARTELGERFDLVAMVGEFRRTLLDELDYRQEARNLARLGENLKKFDRLLVPRPIMDFTTSRVLVDGFFHADPHPGNLSLTADHRTLLDLGMVACARWTALPVGCARRRPGRDARRLGCAVPAPEAIRSPHLGDRGIDVAWAEGSHGSGLRANGVPVVSFPRNRRRWRRRSPDPRAATAGAPGRSRA